MTESLATTFSETLRHECAQDWQAATGHRFVTELCAGTVPDRVMAAYLVQDHRFLDAFLMLLGAAIASADCACPGARNGLIRPLPSAALSASV